MRRIIIAAALLLAAQAAAQEAQPYQDQPPPYQGQGTSPFAQAPQQQQPSSGAPAPGPGRQNKMQAKFEAANTTHDGRLTRDQAQAAHMGRIAKNFDAIDADHKGYVTEQDIRTWRTAQHQARAQQQQQSPPQQQ